MRWGREGGGGGGNLRCLDPRQVLYKSSLLGAKNEKTKRILMGEVTVFCLVGCFSMIIWTPTVLSVLYACVLYFCICICSVQLSMFHMERRFRNTLIIIIIIIIIISALAYIMIQNTRNDLLTYAHCSRWSISHLRPLAIALCSGLLWPFQSSWSLVTSAVLQCLASNCCEAGLSSSSPASSRSAARRVVLDAGFLRVCPIQPHFPRSNLLGHCPVPLTTTNLHFRSSPAVGFCRCASDRC